MTVCPAVTAEASVSVTVLPLSDVAVTSMSTSSASTVNASLPGSCAVSSASSKVSVSMSPLTVAGSVSASDGAVMSDADTAVPLIAIFIAFRAPVKLAPAVRCRSSMFHPAAPPVSSLPEVVSRSS